MGPEGHGTERQALRKGVYNLLLQYQKNKIGNSILAPSYKVKNIPKCKTDFSLILSFLICKLFGL